MQIKFSKLTNYYVYIKKKETIFNYINYLS